VEIADLECREILGIPKLVSQILSAKAVITKFVSSEEILTLHT
jgi:hypothetical protein